MGGGGLQLLVLDVADVEHEADPASFIAGAQHLALYAVPQGRLFSVGALQAHAGQQWLAQGLQVLQAAVEGLAVGGVDEFEPGAEGLAGGAFVQA